MPAPDRITAVLGFQTHRVVEFQRISKRWIKVWLEPRRREWRCPGCGERHRAFYDRMWVEIRDLDLPKHRTSLVVPKYRIECEGCGVKRVPLPFARPWARCTKRFERWLFILTRRAPVSEVARIAEVDWKTVKDAEVRHIAALLRERDLDGITDLGFDEVSERKGHHYLTLATDLRNRRVIWVGRGRDRKVLRRFFRWFGKERTRRIRRVVIDMHDPYEREIRKRCPRASLIYDHFHLSKPLHLALDEIRRRLQATLPPEGRHYLKNKRYLLLRARESLLPRQRVRLSELLRVNEPLNAAYILKEDFRTVFRETDPKQAREALKEWKHRARESRIPELIAFVAMLNRRRYGILNFFQHRITNGLAEGFNNVVKTVKKVAYGFHDWRYFAHKILRVCGRIEDDIV